MNPLLNRQFPINKMNKEKPYYETIPTSMCDFQSFYKKIAHQLPDNCRVVEIGVGDGYSALLLAHELKSLNKNFRLVMIDSCDYGHTDQANTIMRNIILSNLGQYIDFLQIGSLDGSCKFPDNYFDFGFVDASHRYEPTKADVRLWYNKIKDEGILAGHDYFSFENPEVKLAVDEIIPPESLRAENTSKGLGIWWTVKQPTLKMN